MTEKELMMIKRDLQRRAKKMGLGKKRSGAYVFGTLRKIRGNPSLAAERLRRQAEILEMDERLVPSTLTYEDIKDDPKLVAHYRKIMTPMAWKQLIDDWIRSGVNTRRDFVIPKESEYRRMVGGEPLSANSPYRMPKTYAQERAEKIEMMRAAGLEPLPSGLGKATRTQLRILGHGDARYSKKWGERVKRIKRDPGPDQPPHFAELKKAGFYDVLHNIEYGGDPMDVPLKTWIRVETLFEKYPSYARNLRQLVQHKIRYVMMQKRKRMEGIKGNPDSIRVTTRDPKRIPRKFPIHYSDSLREARIPAIGLRRLYEALSSLTRNRDEMLVDFDIRERPQNPGDFIIITKFRSYVDGARVYSAGLKTKDRIERELAGYGNLVGYRRKRVGSSDYTYEIFAIRLWREGSRMMAKHGKLFANR